MRQKGIEPSAGAAVRNGDVLVPGYDVDGKLWTVQYIGVSEYDRPTAREWDAGL
jgi:hypothetical protein